MATKAELIRSYLQKFPAVGPSELARHITETEKGVKVSPSEVSNIKTTLKNRPNRPTLSAAPAARPMALKPAGPGAAATNGRSSAASVHAGHGVADHVAKLKAVAAAIGKEEAKKILDLL